jgi:hypothetical protein
VAECDETLVVLNRRGVPSTDRLGEDSHWQGSRQIGARSRGSLPMIRPRRSSCAQ